MRFGRQHEDVKGQITAAWESTGDRPGTALAAQDGAQIRSSSNLRPKFATFPQESHLNRSDSELALDDQPSVGAFILLVRRMISVWSARFNTMAQELAAYFTQAVQM